MLGRNFRRKPAKRLTFQVLPKCGGTQASGMQQGNAMIGFRLDAQERVPLCEHNVWTPSTIIFLRTEKLESGILIYMAGAMGLGCGRGRAANP